MIGTPLANVLMNRFKTDATVGVWETLLVLAAIYFVAMMAGALGYRVPPEGWRPPGWNVAAKTNAMIAPHDVALADAHKTPQFWLIWIVLVMNVSAGIGVIGAAAPLLQETFGGALFGDPSVGFAQFDDHQRKLAQDVAGGFVGLFSLFNIAGASFGLRCPTASGARRPISSSSSSASFAMARSRRSPIPRRWGCSAPCAA